MLDYHLMKICDLVLHMYLKQRSASITFSNNQLLSKPAEYNVLLLCYTNLCISTVNDKFYQQVLASSNQMFLLITLKQSSDKGA